MHVLVEGLQVGDLFGGLLELHFGAPRALGQRAGEQRHREEAERR